MCLLAGRLRKEGEIKNTKWENSGDRYGFMTLNILKNIY